MGIGYQELLIIFLIVLLLFGGRKIPEIARGLGKGIREFRKARDDIREAIEMEAEETAPETEHRRVATAGPPPQAQPSDANAGAGSETPAGEQETPAPPKASGTDQTS